MKLLGAANNLIQLALNFALLVDDQFRVSDDVHEQNMSDFELSFVFELSGHVRGLREFNGESFQFARADYSVFSPDSREERRRCGNGLFGIISAILKEQASQIQKVSAQLEVSKSAPQVVLNKSVKLLSLTKRSISQSAVTLTCVAAFCFISRTHDCRTQSHCEDLTNEPFH